MISPPSRPHARPCALVAYREPDDALDPIVELVSSVFRIRSELHRPFQTLDVAIRFDLF